MLLTACSLSKSFHGSGASILMLASLIICIASSNTVAADVSCDTYNQEQLDTGCALSHFETSVDLKGWKVRGHTPSDGNCFFAPVADQRQHITPDDLRGPAQLRADTTAYLVYTTGK